MIEVIKHLWLGNSSDAHEMGHGPVDAGLNVAFDLKSDERWPGIVEYAHCGLVDGPGNPTSAYVSAVMQLHAMLSRGKKVLVYCHDGNSRSLAVVLLYLCATRPWNWALHREDVKAKMPDLPDDRPHEAHRQAHDRINWDWLRDVLARM